MATAELLFATGNLDKAAEAQSIIPVKVTHQNVEVDEVQSEDLEYVAEQKAIAAYEKVGKPLFVDDVGVFFPAWNNFPGPYAKHFLNAFGNERIARMIWKEKDKSVLISCVIAYHDGNNVHTFRGDVHGLVAPEPRGKDGWGFDFIIKPEGYDKTFAQLGREIKNQISHRGIALRSFADYLKVQS